MKHALRRVPIRAPRSTTSYKAPARVVRTKQPAKPPADPTIKRLQEENRRLRALLEQKSADRRVTVVIPVYGAHELTADCVASVLPTLGPKDHLLIINDCDPDAIFGEQLALAVSGKERVECIKNDANLGFVGTCNRALAMVRDGDIILLNSDTLVPAGWIDRMVECAYSDDAVGFCSPLSNNAWFQSLRGRHIDDLEDVNKKLIDLRGDYIDVEAAIGFCILLKRVALEKTGILDNAFAPGYGEELDWCLRARAWFKGLLDTRTLVWHRRGASFGDKAKQHQARGMAMLRRKHPEKYKKFAVTCRDAARRINLLSRDLGKKRSAEAPGASPARTVAPLPTNTDSALTGEHCLVVADKPGWAMDNIATALKRADPSLEVAYLSDRLGLDRALRRSTRLLLLTWAAMGDNLRGTYPNIKWVVSCVYEWYSIARNRGMFLRVVSQSDRVLASAPYLYERLAAEYPDVRTKIGLCLDGVDRTEFPRLPVRSGDVLFGWAGSTSHWAAVKRLDRIVRVFEDLGMRDRLLVRDAALGELPHAEMADRFYSKVDCVICFSTEEGTPNPVLEALSCGRSVITTDVGQVPQLLRDCNGRIMLVDSDAQLRDAVLLMCRLPRTISSLPDQYSWTERAPLMIDELRGVLHDSSPMSLLDVRPRDIVLVSDCRGHAFDRIGGKVIEELRLPYISQEYHGDGFPCRSGIVMWFGAFDSAVIFRAGSGVCFYDEVLWTDATVTKLAKECGCLLAANVRIANRLYANKTVRERDVPVFLVEDGVDTALFSANGRASYSGKIRIAWSGISRHRGEPDRDPKGIRIIREAIARLGRSVEWNMAEKGEKSELSFTDMPSLYRRSDVVLCASSAEGTPNPVLEGAACGCFVLSTRVGIVPELLQSGCVGETYTRSVPGLVGAVTRLASNVGILRAAERTNPEVLRRSWDWSVKAQNWGRAIQYLHCGDRSGEYCP